MAKCVLLSLAIGLVCGTFCHSALAMDCPYCIGLIACESDQTIPTSRCTPAIVNNTVSELGLFYRNLTNFTAPSDQYSCVKVEFIPPGYQSNVFVVRGCTSGQNSICGEPTFEYNGNLSCRSYSAGHSLHGFGQGVLTTILLNLPLLISAFALSSVVVG